MKAPVYPQVLASKTSSDALSAFGGYVLAGGGAALFAAKGVVIKLAYSLGSPPSPITLLALRMVIATPIYMLIGVWILRQRHLTDAPKLNLNSTLLAALVGSFGYYIASYLDFVGLIYITAQLERLVLFTYPLIVLLLSAIFLGTKLTIESFAAFALSYSGLIFVFFTGATAATPRVELGVALVGGAALFFAIYQLASKPLILELGSRLFTCIAMSGAAFAVLTHASVRALFLDELVSAQITPSLIAVGVVLAVVCTIIPSFMMSAAIARVGPEAVAVLGTLSPICTVLLAMFILHEPFDLTDAIGTILVMTGVGLYSWLDRRTKNS